MTGTLTVGDTSTSAIVATIKSSNASGTYILFVNGTTPTVEVGYNATYGAAYLYNGKLDSHPTLCLGLADNLRDAIIYKYAGVDYNVWHSGSLKPYQFTNWADTRSVNQVPNDYDCLFIMRGIKNLTTIGLSDGRNYATVWGWRGWPDRTGGHAWEIASTDNDLYTRHGETTSWTSWAKILNSSNYQNYPNTKVGVSTIWLYPENNNEINFGGTSANNHIFFGYTSKDNRPRPTEYHFGRNDANIHAKFFKSYVATGTQPFQCVSTTTCTNLNADLLDGFHGDANSTANTYVRRNQNKYISVNYINSDTAKNENHDFTQIITTDDGDNYYRKAGINFFMKRLNSYTKTIDLKSLDANKYYPISFQLVQRNSFIRIKIWNCLDGNKPTWATHRDGFAAAIEWDTTTSGYGSQEIQRIIYADNYRYCDKSPCGGIEQNTMASVEIVYLRGGAIYYYNNNDNIEAIINSNGYSTDSFSAPVIDNIKKRAYSCYNLSLRSFSTLYCSDIISYRLNISSTSTFAGKATFNGGLSGTLTGNASTATKLTTARTIWGQSFNGTANVSGSLTGVASITASGNITAAGAITAKSSSSDIRLKKNIKQYNALDIIHKLKSVKYYWNDTAKANSPIFNDNEEHYGLIAQDLLINGYSQWVSNCFKDYYVIQYERLIPVLWRGIQQVDNEVATLKKKIATLEKELSSVKRQLSL